MAELIITPGDEEEPEEEVTMPEYINMCMTVFETFVSVDVEVLDPSSKRRIQQMRRMAIKIAHYYMSKIDKDLADGDKKAGKLGPDE